VPIVLKQTLGFLLNDSARLLRKRFEQRARRIGLTRAQWQVLAYLARNEGIQQSALAEILEVEPITLVRILDRLEDADYVERRRHPTDRRIWQLFLQAKTHPVLEEMVAIGNDTKDEAIAGLSEEDIAILTRCLQTIRNNLGAASASALPLEKGARHG
jgi:MarR family transcriptional regulator for hemolysin